MPYTDYRIELWTKHCVLCVVCHRSQTVESLKLRVKTAHTSYNNGFVLFCCCFFFGFFTSSRQQTALAHHMLLVFWASLVISVFLFFSSDEQILDARRRNSFRQLPPWCCDLPHDYLFDDHYLFYSRRNKNYLTFEWINFVITFITSPILAKYFRDWRHLSVNYPVITDIEPFNIHILIIIWSDVTFWL